MPRGPKAISIVSGQGLRTSDHCCHPGVSSRGDGSRGGKKYQMPDVLGVWGPWDTETQWGQGRQPLWAWAEGTGLWNAVLVNPDGDENMCLGGNR